MELDGTLALGRIHKTRLTDLAVLPGLRTTPAYAARTLSEPCKPLGAVESERCHDLRAGAYPAIDSPPRIFRAPQRLLQLVYRTGDGKGDRNEAARRFSRAELHFSKLRQATSSWSSDSKSAALYGAKKSTRR